MTRAATQAGDADSSYILGLISSVKTSIKDHRVRYELQFEIKWCYGVYISQLVIFSICCTSVSDFHFKNLQITSKLLTQG